MHSAKNISGPWVQQSRDVNCQADAPMCGAPGFPKEDRPLSITIHAQGLGLSMIGDEFIWQVCAGADSLTVNLLTHKKQHFIQTGSGEHKDQWTLTSDRFRAAGGALAVRPRQQRVLWLAVRSLRSDRGCAELWRELYKGLRL